MSVDVVDSVLAAARKEGGWDDTNKRKESLLDDTEEAGNEFHRVMVDDDVGIRLELEQRRLSLFSVLSMGRAEDIDEPRPPFIPSSGKEIVG
ncbi:hypothetical protein PRIPAC_87890 [Pristionchus pacificus]|uniref:Uncharacterized protein n=1 Tax=Pristionchus pacificus TaxID=54126 RepID=A0A2A6B8M0_PRIPA|nr:hypothetical protein PRIPAC_87890 [Pristionchus pacificus]|eukprot:PDM62230.1 hypothetical protein PRIPAC_51672 [Pristionchus pacificus]